MGKNYNLQIKSPARICSSKSLDLQMKNTEQLTPAFCFKYTQSGYSLGDLLKTNQVEFFKDFLNKLDNLSQLSWQQIKINNRKANGYEIISRDALTKPLPNFITEDRNLLCFSLSGIFRMLGVRDGKVFYVLFIDPKGTLYRHDKRKH